MVSKTLFHLSIVLVTIASTVTGHHQWGPWENGDGNAAATSAADVSTAAALATSSTIATTFELSTTSNNAVNGNAATSSTTTSSLSSAFTTDTSGKKGRKNRLGNGQGSSSTTTTTSAFSQSSDSSSSSSNDSNNSNNSNNSGNNGSNNENNNGNNSENSNGNNNGNADSDSGATLNSANIQSASDSTGGAIAEAGQSPSSTDPDNFINFCTGQTLTNGTQNTGGSCNGIPMGQIPSKNNMISTIITNPLPGDTLPSNQNFTVTLQVQNLEAGTFTNPNTTYYSAPQTLKNGNIVGHTHITIQSLGNSLSASTPPDPTTFMFFKGVDNAGNGEGGLSATVAGGLPAGAYRVCTMTSAANHQPVLMPVAQRGSQDDCTKFLVADQGGNNNGQSNFETTAQTTGSTAFGGKRRRSMKKF